MITNYTIEPRLLFCCLDANSSDTKVIIDVWCGSRLSFTPPDYDSTKFVHPHSSKSFFRFQEFATRFAACFFLQNVAVIYT